MTNRKISRRALVDGAAAGIAVSMLAPAIEAAAGTTARKSPDRLGILIDPDDPATLPPPPPQAPTTQGYIDVDGAQLYYWDTGGMGEAVVMEHAGTGSAESWPYQQPVLAAAGYRVIGYARRGVAPSKILTEPTRYQVVEDLHALANALKLDRFHLIGVAAGGYVTTYYGLAHPERVASATIVCSRAGIVDEGYDAPLRALLPPGLVQTMPHDFIELCASYRFANPVGAKRWAEIYKASLSANHEEARRFGQHLSEQSVTLAKFATFAPPLMLIYGGADLYVPPAAGRVVVDHRPGTPVAIMNEVGHSAQWEQPRQFNRLVLDFLSKHPIAKA